MWNILVKKKSIKYEVNEPLKKEECSNKNIKNNENAINSNKNESLEKNQGISDVNKQKSIMNI